MATKPTTAIWQASHRLATNCLGFFPLVEQSGNPTGYRAAGGNLSGVLQGCTWVTTPGGKGLQFVGASSQYLDLGVNLAPAALPATVVLVFKTAGSWVYDKTVCTHSSTVQQYAGLMMQMRDTGKLQLLTGGADGTLQHWITDSALSLSTWYTAVLVLTNMTTFAAYLNGTLAASTIQNTGTVYSAGTGNGRLGGFSFDGGRDYGNAVIDAFGVWAKAFSAADIASFNADPWGVVRAQDWYRPHLLLP